jgi:putative flippase GtrA
MAESLSHAVACVRASVYAMSASRRQFAERVSHLRSPDSGTVGQGLRYAVAGTIVALVYLATTTVLAEFVGVAFQLALASGFLTALLVHFTLQRFFVWVHHSEFALGLGAQVGRYLLVAGAQYAITAGTTSVLPRALDLPVTLVYLATAITLASTNFLIFRGGVFHAEQ